MMILPRSGWRASELAVILAQRRTASNIGRARPRAWKQERRAQRGPSFIIVAGT